MDDHGQFGNQTHMEENGSRLNQAAYVGSRGMGDILSRKHPFAEAIMAVSLLARWKGPVIDKYDEKFDPDEHIDTYVTQISLYTTDDVLWCRIFPTSLKGTTLSWFTRLPPLSIDCFNTLMAKLSTQFTTSKPHHLTSLALVNIRQERARPFGHSWINLGGPQYLRSELGSGVASSGNLPKVGSIFR